MPTSHQLSSLFRHSKALVTSGHRHTPLPTGPHSSVGFRDFLLGNSRKTGLLVRLFYPSSNTLPTDPKKWPKWLPHEGYEKGLGDVAGVRSRVISALARAANPLDNVRVPAIENGALLQPSNDKYPLLVFSHGLGGYRSLYSTICTEFASRGFVVAAVEHRDNSAAMSFYYRNKSNNNSAENEQNYNPEDYGLTGYKPPRPIMPLSVDSERELVWIRHRYVSLIDHTPGALQFRHAQVKHRAGECSRAADFLENLNSGAAIENALDSNYSATEFKNHLDTDKLAIMGHSFGGATTILTAIEDGRFKVAVGLDAWAFPLKTIPLFDCIPKPLLLINAETLGTERHNVKKMTEIFKNGDHERKQAVTINGSTHMQQCDVPLVYSKLMNSLLSRLDPKKSTIDTLDVHDLTNAKALQFISRYLNIEANDAIEQFLHANKKSFRPSYE